MGRGEANYPFMSAVGLHKKESVDDVLQFTKDNFQCVHLETDKQAFSMAETFIVPHSFKPMREL